MRGVLVDTGPLYAAYDSSDRYYDQAHKELSNLNQQKLPVILPYLVLAECHSLLLKRFNPKVGFRFLKEMAAGTTSFNSDATDY